LGSTLNSNSLITINLIDPNGNKIKSLEIISNSEGIFSEERLKIPKNAETGLWVIEVTSGSNLDTVEFNVFSTISEGMELKVVEEAKMGDLLKMQITASSKTNIMIEIIDVEGYKVQEITCVTTEKFRCESFWSIPKDIVPGTYTIKAYDSMSSTEATIDIKKK
jgi:hypothetical protein